MVDFSKKLGSVKTKKPLDPTAIYDTLDRTSDKGPLRPAQEAILREWHEHRREERDLLIKLQTGQGKTLIGLLILQSRLNENTTLNGRQMLSAVHWRCPRMNEEQECSACGSW